MTSVSINDSSAFDIWEGIYATFEESGGDLRVFSEDHWLHRCEMRALAQRDESARQTELVGLYNASTAYALPTVAALTQARKRPGEPVSVLDFGGAFAFSFHVVADSVADPALIDYHVIDNVRMCERAAAAYGADPRLAFHPELPSNREFDIVHLGSSIQYVDDWVGLVRTLAAYRAEYLVFDDVPAGDIPDYVTNQYYYGKLIPHRFFNAGTFVRNVVDATGYQMCFKSRYVGMFLGHRGELPMSNFPPSYRLRNALNFVFARPGSGVGPDPR